MAHGSKRIGLSIFLLLAGGVAGNVLLLQPPGGRQAAVGMVERSRVAGATGAGASAEELGAGRDTMAGASGRSAASRVATGGVGRDARPALGGSGEITRAVQRELQLRGYEAGSNDGSLGPVVRAAVLAYEHDHGLPLTAEPSEALLKHILLDGGDAASGGATPANVGPQAAQVIRAVHQALSAAGYRAGRGGGQIDDDLVRAIREFESDQRLPETGRISGLLMAKLARYTGGGGRSAR